MPSLWSTAVTAAAGGQSGRPAAPPPAPTSSTEPPAGRASSARRRDGAAGPSPAATASSAARAKRSVGQPHGVSGAAARISGGMAQEARSSRHRRAESSVIGLTLVTSGARSLYPERIVDTGVAVVAGLVLAVIAF